jgi:phage FluMu gp28-like protein
MDQTGMGEKPVEDAKRRYGNDRVTGILFSPANKLDMATTIRRRFEERRVRIPMGSDELREDLNRTKRMQGPGGSVTLQTDDDDEAGHADRFWALALAMLGADGGVPTYGYTPAYGAGERDRRHDDDADRRGRARFGRGGW